MCIGDAPKIDTSAQDFQREEAERARAREEARQGRVSDGLAHIAAIFEGGSYAPQGGQAQTYAGMAPLLEERETQLRDFYLPQLDKQRGRATEDLTYALADAGLLGSTVAGRRQADLSEDYALQRGSILSDIAADIAGQRTLQNQSRQSIEASLRASGDASSASDAALSTAVNFRQDAPELNPIGNVFFGVSEGLGAARQGYETERIRQLATPKLNTGNASRIVRSAA